MRCPAETKPSQAVHLLEENYRDQLWQVDFKMIKMSLSSLPPAVHEHEGFFSQLR